VDCEKFDRVVLDLLYDELDELTHAAAKRHSEHCTRCRRIGAELRATREVGMLPIVEPPDSLEARILEMERQARAELPLAKRIGRGVSIAASYAMRPQLAMGALLLLMIGSSLLLLRARPGARNEVHVTERGIPEAEVESTAVYPAAAEKPPTPDDKVEEAPAPRARSPQKDDTASAGQTDLAQAAPAAAEAKAVEAPSDDAELASAMTAYKEGRFAEAERQFDAVAAGGGDDAATAALKAAEVARDGKGCAVAAERFEQVSIRYSHAKATAEQATWHAAECYRQLARLEDARRNYEALLESATFQLRAQAALDSLGQGQDAVAARRAAAPATAGGAAAPAAPSKPAAAKVSGARKAAPETSRDRSGR
jgi:tetratricopeptide (TPR) repeat protein